jgi:hypothetical protein
MSSVTRIARSLAIILIIAAAAAAAAIPARAVGYQPNRAINADHLAGGRVFSTSFESAGDFAGFYIVPQNYMGTTSHDLSTENVLSGTYAHRAWVYGANPPSTPDVNNGHRGYPTVQLQKTPGGGYVCPCEITLHVWLDMPLDVPGEWFSFATFTPDPTDAWARTILVNISAANPAPGTAAGGVVHLMHVPNQGERLPTFQTSTILFPMRQWVELKIYLDLDPAHGEAKVWQDGQLVSTAPVNGGNGKLEQAHFGMYAAPELASGVVYNDDLEIREAVTSSVGGIAEAPAIDAALARRSAGASPGDQQLILAGAASAITVMGATMLYRRKRRVS